MKDLLQGLGLVAAIVLTPILLIWGLGAFLTWDAGWAFVTQEARVAFAFYCVIGLICWFGALAS